MQGKFGYPSYRAYYEHFGSFNNALIVARLKINVFKHRLDGTETCSYCGRRADEIPNFRSWIYHNDTRYCRQHGQHGIPDYVIGNLNKKSSTGKAFVSQRIVAKVLGLQLKNDCNCSVNFEHPFDLYDKDRYDMINVKDSMLLNDNAWHFNLNQKETSDTYILVGFDENRKNILHVWITDPLDDLTYQRKSIGITNNIDNGLTRAKPWEVDPKPYNDMLHRMSEKRKETKGKGCFLRDDDLRK